MKIKVISILIALVFFASFAYADSSVQITPNPAHDSDGLFCNVLIGGSGYTYEWYVDGQRSANNNGAYLSAAETDPGESWRCVAKKYYPNGVGWIELGRDTVTIQADPINHAPVATIITPANSASFENGSQIFFNGTATDPEEGQITDSNRLVWTSSIDGVFSYGNHFYSDSLSVGTHTITLTATDLGGLYDADAIVITITPSNNTNNTNTTNHAPLIHISSPPNGTAVVNKTWINFAANASDFEDGVLSGNNIKWYDELGTNFANGTFATEVWSIGNHTITAVATDSGNLSANDSIIITVYEDNSNTTNHPPVIDITRPSDGSVFFSGNLINLSANATDYEDGDVSAHIRWYSDVDGSLGQGASVLMQTANHANTIITLVQNNSANITVSGIAHEVEVVDVDDLETMCGVSVDGYVRWISKNQDSTVNGINIVVLNATIVNVPLQDEDYCKLNLKDASDEGKLSIGDHVITATVTDSNGSRASDSINIEIREHNQINLPPVVDLIYPLNGTVFSDNANIHFLANAVDPEEGVLVGNRIRWYSGAQEIGIGNEFYSTLPAGNHTITVYAYDSQNLSDSESVSITVNPANVGNNTVPYVNIIRPNDGTNFTNGTFLTFEGSAIDNEDGTALQIGWYSNLDGFLSTSRLFSTYSLSMGTHIITLNATDSNGATGTDSIIINIVPQGYGNNNPSINIISPADNSGFVKGSYIWFDARATDPEDGVLTGDSIVWSSSIDGNFATGTNAWLNTLSSGTHNITATATDSDGGIARDTITLTINNATTTNLPPAATIIHPNNGSVYSNGTAVSFEGNAVDPEEGFIYNVAWYSDIDGQLSNSLIFSASNLSAGNHTITFVATDSHGAQGSDNISIQIVTSSSTNLNPQISIVSPANNSTFNQGNYIMFTAFATDPEDGVLTGNSVQWYDNGIGFGSGTNLWLNTLANGTHNITAVASDSKGATASNTITIQVGSGNITNNMPVINIITPAENSTYNYGNYIMFNAEATDPEDGILTGNSVKWYDNGNNFANGTGAWTNNFTVGLHNISATATDSNGLTATDSIILSINSQNISNNAPVVKITRPWNNSFVYQQGDLIMFEGFAIDPEDGILDCNHITLSSSINGNFGNETLSCAGNFSGLNITFIALTNNLSVGIHNITLTGRDNQGATATDSVIVTIIPITNQTNRTEPNVTIILPLDGSNYNLSSMISFLGTAVDADGNNITNLQWVSDISGEIGNVSSFTTSLSAGVHNIAFVATDSFGLQGTDFVTINVANYSNNNTNNTNNTNTTSVFIDILSPVNGGVYDTPYGWIVINASDYNNVVYKIDNNPEGNYYGMPVLSYFENGNHTITARITTANGTANDTVSFRVNYIPPETNAPVVKLYSPGDRSMQFSNAVDFLFNVSEESAISFCQLKIENSSSTVASYFVTDAKKGLNTFHVANIPSGDFAWYVECFDAYNNKGVSEKRLITIATGNYTFNVPKTPQKVSGPEYELLLKNIEFDEYAGQGELVAVDISLQNSGDFDLEDVNLKVSSYDLDVYASTSLDIQKGKTVTKTLHFTVPDYAQNGVYDLKIEAGNSKVKRSIYREIVIS